VILSPDVGNLVRFRLLLTTIQISVIMMRAFASSLFRWLTAEIYGSRQIHSRHNRTEFPMASPNACNGSRAGSCASIDALRPFNNSVKKFKNNYEISFTRETFAALARRIPTKGRSSAPSRRAHESSAENILAKIGGVFRRKRQERTTKTGPAGAQWLRAFASGA